MSFPVENVTRYGKKYLTGALVQHIDNTIKRHINAKHENLFYPNIDKNGNHCPDITRRDSR